MESTPVSYETSEDSGWVSGSFSASSVFRSTPKENLSTPKLPAASRKRKFNQINSKNLQDVLELCPSRPIFSSTLNEALVDNLENCHLKTNIYPLESSVQLNDTSRGILSNFKTPISFTPATPEKKLYSEEFKKLKIGSLSSLKLIEDSPIKEAHDILYANLKSNVRKVFSPFKFRENLDKFASPAKKCLFDSSEKFRTSKLFNQVVANPVIMSEIFKYLSDGDIYRLSLVSVQLKQSVLLNSEARNRFEIFMEVHRENKENYKVTPPRSPEKNDSPPGSPSRFNEYIKMAKLLSYNQSLTKCPRCGKPSLVDNSIAQCQNLISCGYIHCQKCYSFSETGPDDFYDRCQSSALVRNSTRASLSDMSNSVRSIGYNSLSVGEPSSRIYSIFHSPKSSRGDSSGFISENEYTPRPFQAKKNLTEKLKSIRPDTKVFHLFNDVVPASAPLKKRPSLSAVPVIPLENQRKIQEMEPPSPPKVRYVACSKQSKRNLKRLTR